MAKRIRPVVNSPSLAVALLVVFQAALALLAQRGLAEGGAVPELRAADLAGRVRTLADFPGRTTLLVFWEPDHARSLAAVCELARLAANYESAALATVASGHDKADVERALGECAVRPVVLLDRDRSVFGAFQIIALPTAMIIAPDRKLLFKAAGFNSSGLGAIEARLDEIYGRTRPSVAPASGNPEALRSYTMAQELLKRGMRRQAEDTLQDVTRRHPEFRPAWVSLGYCRIEDNRPAEAQAAFETAVKLDGSAADVAAGMAWVSWTKDDLAGAADWTARAREGDPHYEVIREIRKHLATGVPK